jgi:tetratricopeptide (TPR) repeat protein
MNGQRQQSVKWVFVAFLVLILNSGYLAAFADPSLFYMINVLLHVVLGMALVLPFFIFVRRFLQNDAPKGKELAIYTGKLGYWFLTPCVLTGVYLTLKGATQSKQWILYIHIIAGLIGAGFFQKSIRSVAHKVSTKNSFDVAGRAAWVVLIVAVCIPIFAGIYRLLLPSVRENIVNPPMAPERMADIAMLGDRGPFFPSAVATSTKELISPQSFLSSESCGRSQCHPDIYQQWRSSAHHYSSLNNPWYRRALEYLQETPAYIDTSNHETTAKPEKWCAGCHDPALLVSGMLEQPRRAGQELEQKPEAHAGVACTACHSMVQVKSTMGQGDYVIEDMPLLEWATNENKMLRRLYDFLVRTDPAPHRKSMLKPFHRRDAAEFCSACHKAHLDEPVNQYRWVRSFNDYDAWQAGPFSGHTSRGFETPQNCADCHMPLLRSRDAGNTGGKVRSHLFLGANTALPVVNQDQKQFAATVEWLRDKIVSVDIFALGKPDAERLLDVQNQPASEATQKEQPGPLPSADEPMPFTFFASGDEQSMKIGAGGLTRYPAAVVAPIDQSNATVSRGEEVRLDVVVRSRRVGHFFPSGTVDANEVWLELKAVDDLGKIIFWSGAASDGGKGQVEPSAHFYRSYLVDDHGNHIDKNNILAAREAVYVNLIPPGGADVAHYRLRVPAECGSKIHLVAKLNYRKFSWQHTQWTFAGLGDSPHGDFDGGTPLAKELMQNGVASIPVIPIIEMARDEATLAVVASDSAKPGLVVQTGKRDAERWNDYGIGLRRQGDLKSAEAAFLKVTTLAPDNAEAWVNVGITRLQEGNLDGAQSALESAMKINPDLASTRYYYGLTLKAQGKYDEAQKYFKKIVTKYPRDRVAKIERGHLYLLMRDYDRAIRDFEKVLSIDPENAEAYYHLIRAYRAVGDEEKAGKAEKLYQRFHADRRLFSSGQSRTNNPDAWRERQPIHEHSSVALPFGAEAASLPAHDGKAPAEQ